uniref:BED-type domain-containing protein n=1 Tax=Opuntia streptacantha TaxID=393608 RepID=A0A7C8YD19_OPUST
MDIVSTTLINIKERRSKVWRDLEQGKNAQGEKTATCKHCKVVMTANPNSGTSHLKRHLDRCPQRLSGVEIGELGIDVGEDFVFNMNELRKDFRNCCFKFGLAR